MNELVFKKKDDVYTDSLTVADAFSKEHRNVLRDIEKLIEGIAKSGESQQTGGVLKNEETHPTGGALKNEQTQQMFVKTWYKHPQNGQRYTKYLMNRDGFSLLVMGFTGKKALEWKLKYIKAFNQMEEVIRENNTASWLEARDYGKQIRKAETDMIQQLVEYAKEQGSEHSNKLYMTYSKLANKMAGVKDRDMASIKQLSDLTMAENIILHIIKMGIIEGKHYKVIYQECKTRLALVKDIAFLEGGVSNAKSS